MYTVKEIYAYIDTFAPFDRALSFDNVGLLVGDGEQPVQRAMLALDITPEVVEEAASWGAQLIISHHPVIFQPLRALPAGSAVYRLARHGMAAICAHTSLDFAPEYGVNTELARVLGLKNGRWILPCEQVMEAYLGELPQPLSARELAEKVKGDLQCEQVRYVDGGRPIRYAAVCSGAGADCLSRAANAGADALITGESKHHLLLLARETGITLIEAGHFSTEAVVLPMLQKKLSEAFPALVLRCAATSREPAHFV